jgi:glycerophosphoryl diester phosphodiesterase
MRLRLGDRSVRLKAHMCRLHATIPGNSLPALRRCLEHGVEMMEVDVRAAGNGDFVIAHDEPGRASPRLANLLAELRGAGSLQLDLKEDAPLPAEVLDTLAEQLLPHAERLIVSGGSEANVRGVGERVPGLRLGYDPLLRFDMKDGHYVGPLAELGLSHEEVFRRLWNDAPSSAIWYLRAILLARLADDGFDAVAWLGGRGAEVDAWTIDVPHEALLRRVVGLGVAQVTTNTPLAWIRRLSPGV